MYTPVSKSSMYFKEKDAVTGKRIRNESKIAAKKSADRSTSDGYMPKRNAPVEPKTEYNKKTNRLVKEHNDRARKQGMSKETMSALEKGDKGAFLKSYLK